MTEKKEANKPEKKFRSGSVCVTIWRNKSKDGNEFQSFSPEASYRNEDGEWLPSKSLSLGQLLRLRECINKAVEYGTVHEE